jgi:hypothetical protein
MGRLLIPAASRPAKTLPKTADISSLENIAIAVIMNTYKANNLAKDTFFYILR